MIFLIIFLTDDGIIEFYVIKANDEIIGFCTLEYYKNIRNFKKIGDVMYFISPDYTGKGVGTQVFAKLENDALKKGITKIVVDISDENIGSLRFHMKNGFKEYGKLEDCWEKTWKKTRNYFFGERTK